MDTAFGVVKVEVLGPITLLILVCGSSRAQQQHQQWWQYPQGVERH